MMWLTLLILKSYEIKVFYLSITGRRGTVYIPIGGLGTVRAFGYGYGTGVRYGGTVWGYGMVVRYGGTVLGYGMGGTVRGVRYGGTVQGYVVPVQCTHRTCFQEMW